MWSVCKEYNIKHKKKTKNYYTRPRQNDYGYLGKYRKTESGKILNNQYCHYGYKKFISRVMNKRYRHLPISFEDTGYKSKQFRKGKFSIEYIIY